MRFSVSSCLFTLLISAVVFSGCRADEPLRSLFLPGGQLEGFELHELIQVRDSRCGLSKIDAEAIPELSVALRRIDGITNSKLVRQRKLSLDMLKQHVEAGKFQEAVVIKGCSRSPRSDCDSAVTATMAALSAAVSSVRVMHLDCASSLNLKGAGRRLLQSTTSSTSAYDSAIYPVPMTPNVLNGIFVAFLLIIISLVGFCCLFGLQTPARFESDKQQLGGVRMEH
eukprot:CAMPEP_0196660314 /NCGR_PEP_ID=MMETSP1086-20130531/39094_1 /TAXON_ID=77921 /ORGANISM="Cyanoptyche  gloeocystis , Strain SAG4.97" /LENGTH=225 /DNA_ID=CAMNT_0041994651 /DNA_START=78 /DNA_END=755 /DNA_ORIENTATION=-